MTLFSAKYLQQVSRGRCFTFGEICWYARDRCDDVYVHASWCCSPRNSHEYGERRDVSIGKSSLHLIDGHDFSSYAHADFSLYKGLCRTLKLLMYLYTYDVACQHFVNLLKRMKRWLSPEVYAIIEKIIPALPSFHGDGHCWYCRDKFALKYTKGAGETYGEPVEHVWHVMNPVGLNTREMNPGHREDSLNGQFGEWNFQKIEAMGEWDFGHKRRKALRVKQRSFFIGI